MARLFGRRGTTSLAGNGPSAWGGSFHVGANLKSTLTELSLVEVSNLILDRQVSAFEVTEACLEQIDRWNPEINAFIEVERDTALESARQRDTELTCRGPRGSLHGVPLAHKDVYYRKGKIASAGSIILKDRTASFTSTVLERLDSAGAIYLGRLNMGEFAANPTGQNDTFGDCRNPWNGNHVTGGSSSGCGAALAARLIFGSLGSDTGGSVRIPAAANGVVGLSPTRGRISRYGVFPRSPSFDTVGPVARTSRDCARLAEVIAGFDSRDGASSDIAVPPLEQLALRSIKKLKIGIPGDEFCHSVDAEIMRALRVAADVLQSAGGEITPIRLPDPQPAYELNELISSFESAEIHKAWLQERPEDYPAFIRARFDQGRAASKDDVDAAMQELLRIRANFLADVFNKVDVVLCPIISIPVPTWKEARVSELGSSNWKKASSLASLTRLFNVVDVPAISVPCGFTESGLPTAIQIVGRPYDEATILSVAHTYENETAWWSHRPTLA